MYSFIGSYAVNRHLPEWLYNDIDILTNDNDPTDQLTEEKSSIPAGCRLEIHYSEGFGGFEPLLAEGRFPSLSALLALKMSHLPFNKNRKWIRHARDCIKLLDYGVGPNREIYSSLLPFWQRRFNKRKGYLNKTNKEFFSDNVKRVYEHDSLHFAVSYYGRPLYEMIKPDTSKAYCSKKLFDELHYDDQLRLAREEIYVTALERFLIPNDFKSNPTSAYRNALQQLITSMTSGFFCDFIVWNLHKLHKPGKDFVEDFHRGIKTGLVRPLDN